MSQSWNGTAVRLAFDVMFKRQWLAIPHVTVTDIRYINFCELKKAGCRAVVYDKDNCITNPYEDHISLRVKPGWDECLRVFGRENVLIMSNSAGSSDDKDFEKARHLDNVLGVQVVKHGGKKPGGHDAILQALGGKDVKLEELAFVGDRLLTDVVFGNLGGMLTIHTQPFSLKRDNRVAKSVRTMENALMLPFFRWLRHNRYRGALNERVQTHPLLSGAGLTRTEPLE
ncbi:HAD superfamily (subfamily IIIA) phosphatase [Sphaeroforma arctica JP610]|uniref:HAD superfamily (Subfamily IIIA) phosphatase n=1 Tax=Sphaeroforma arctica JP610 TaxID=667725 RepID=A0A0L0G5Q0_9EUKA|nr:HAD superfamily (subfamily IIIA) phosphatase [Sphaeroforma arctica JP610]KNC84350.1 HAD superfamily (subfamily IIIA) phosphatase [Sphaeroforma arctica JP610]|eukprot:XP_014158252.1 HAD superfamily (subfamily IIIA) phosphatase [Sphaeroforma arctica JP610]